MDPIGSDVFHFSSLFIIRYKTHRLVAAESLLGPKPWPSIHIYRPGFIIPHPDLRNGYERMVTIIRSHYMHPPNRSFVAPRTSSIAGIKWKRYAHQMDIDDEVEDETSFALCLRLNVMCSVYVCVYCI
eukprot:598360_1